MTPDQQARERLAREATPGPWKACLSDRYGHGVPSRAVVAFFEAQHGCQRGLFTEVPWPDGEPAPRRSGDADAAHIAANSPSVILADLARLRALEEAHEHLPRELALAHAEADAATERVQHLLTTIDVERTARKEAEDEVARLRGALEEVRQAVSHPLMSRDVSADARAAILPTIDAALHAQDTEVGR